MVMAVVLAPTAMADGGGGTCISYNTIGYCLVWAEEPGDSGSSGVEAVGGDGSVQAITVNGQSCFPAGLIDPQPAKSDPVWAGHTDGAIYGCEVAAKGGRGGVVGGTAGFVIPYWAATAPAAPPDPAVLAQQAVSSMGLRAISIGIVPLTSSDAVGLVGMPNWMWVADPSPVTWGPTSASASSGGWTVTATARVASVAWDMGDGQVVACGAGTAYEPSFGRASSPDCGHVYDEQGQYTVRATSHWVITWVGIGRTGTITMDLTQSAAVTVGEAQVLTQT